MKLLTIISSVLLCGLVSAQFEPIVPYYRNEQSSSRIANGHAASPLQFPHVVSLQFPAGNALITCGGSLLSNSWVLTAAHCTIGRDQVNLRFGTISLVTGGISITSFHLVTHEQYNPITLLNDVGLVQLPITVPTSAAISPVRLPAASQLTTPFTEFQGTIAGWGETTPGNGVENLLRWVFKRIIPNAQCSTIYGPQIVGDHVLCTLGYTNPNNQGACTGDSGSPLTIVEGGVVTQIASVSFTSVLGCNVGFPNGYMRTANQLQWINQHTGIPIRP